MDPVELDPDSDPDQQHWRAAGWILGFPLHKFFLALGKKVPKEYVVE
jgi:hypothetical protein